MTDPGLLRRAARRAERRPGFLASALLPYARAEGLGDEELAARLGCRRETLPQLLLCRRPNGEGADWRAAVETIAARFSLDPERLAEILRLADALASLGAAAESDRPRLLAAARDREDES